LEFQEKAKLSYPIKKDNILWKTGLWVDLYYLDSVGLIQKQIEKAIKLDNLVLRTFVTKL
jgi:ribosomal protein S6